MVSGSCNWIEHASKNGQSNWNHGCIIIRREKGIAVVATSMDHILDGSTGRPGISGFLLRNGRIMQFVTTRLCGKICHLPLLLVLTLASCVGDNRMTATNADVVIIGKVTGTSPLPSGETASRKRWSISIEIVQITQGLPSVKIGDTATIQVHSVVKTFGVDTSDIVGKRFRIS